MKFIKKINEFFGQEEEIEREDVFAGDEEEGDFYFDEEGHDEEEGDFSHEEENWGDEEDSSMSGSSRVKSFDDFGGEEECEPCGDDEEEHYGEEHYGHEEDHFGHEEDHYGDEEDHYGDEDVEGDENAFVESFRAFNEKKKINPGLQAYLDKKAGKKSKKSEEDEEEEDEKSTKGGKKAKPDFLDLDKDGNKKESMKKAAKDAKAKKK